MPHPRRSRLAGGRRRVPRGSTSQACSPPLQAHRTQPLLGERPTHPWRPRPGGGWHVDVRRHAVGAGGIPHQLPRGAQRQKSCCALARSVLPAASTCQHPLPPPTHFAPWDVMQLRDPPCAAGAGAAGKGEPNHALGTMDSFRLGTPSRGELPVGFVRGGAEPKRYLHSLHGGEVSKTQAGEAGAPVASPPNRVASTVSCLPACLPAPAGVCRLQSGSGRPGAAAHGLPVQQGQRAARAAAARPACDHKRAARRTLAKGGKRWEGCHSPPHLLSTFQLASAGRATGDTGLPLSPDWLDRCGTHTHCNCRWTRGGASCRGCWIRAPLALPAAAAAAAGTRTAVAVAMQPAPLAAAHVATAATNRVATEAGPAVGRTAAAAVAVAAAGPAFHGSSCLPCCQMIGCWSGTLPSSPRQGWETSLRQQPAASLCRQARGALAAGRVRRVLPCVCGAACWAPGGALSWVPGRLPPAWHAAD